MSDQTPPPESTESSATQNVSGGVTVQPGGDVNIGGDVVGRDKITQTTTNVTNVGMSPEAVRRLVITVGVLVFVTALCFFSGGIALGAVVFQAFHRPVDASVAAAQDFQAGLNGVLAKPAGEPFRWSYTESDLNSYLVYTLGPQIGFDGQARFLGNDEVAFQGAWLGLGGLPVTVVTRMETNSAQLYHSVSAAIQLLPLPNSSFGWVAVPTSMVQPLVDAINQGIGQGFTTKAINSPTMIAQPNNAPGPAADAPLTIIGLGQ